MSIVGYSTLEVIPSVVRLRANLERQTAGDMAAAGRTAGSKFGDEAGRTGATSFKSRMSGALKGYAPFAGLAIGAGVTTLFKSAIDEASSLAESANKINVVFGDAAAQVNAFADSASEGLGQSDLQARNAAATFGVYGKAAQLAGEDLGNFATELTALSSDLASFYDTDIQTAIEAIGSGLRGEAEPLRQFGVLLDDATLRSEALRLGLVKTTKDALTPQQKVLAAHASIMAQTADAQGDFARTSEGLANSSRDLAADWADMRAELGAELLPAMLEFVGFLKDDALPALETTGGAVKSAVSTFASLPPPILAATGAFVALKVAAATGLTAAVAAGAVSVGSAMQGLAIRSMLARDAFVAARTASMQVTPTFVAMSRSANIATASLAGLRAASVGAGAAFRGSMSKVSAFVGGPWGAAFIAGTAILMDFYGEAQKVKAQVESMKGSFDQMTGEFTEETARNALGIIGDEWLAYAKDIGISMEDLTAAAVEGGPALDAFLEKYGDILREDSSIDSFTGQIEEANRAVALAHEAFSATKEGVDAYTASLGLAANESGQSANATDGASRALITYRDRLNDANDALARALKLEEKRALAIVQRRRDEIALRETLRSAREEAEKGKDVLFDQSEAADANMSALLDLADQWNSSTPKVRNAEGAFEDFRRKMIDVAQDMTTADGKAKKLVDSLLTVPKDVPLRFRSEGYQQTLAELKALKAEIALISKTHPIRFQAHADQLPQNPTMAGGGLLRGPGTGTSDSILLWGSNGEFMQRKAAVDYYGVEFMRRLNALQVPKLPGYAHGGPIVAPAQPVGPTGMNIAHMTVVAQDWRDFARKGQQKAVAAMSDGVNWG